jgi:hypothetical protein
VQHANVLTRVRFTLGRRSLAADVDGWTLVMAKAKMMDQPFTENCNSLAKFTAAREWLQENGGATVVRDALRADGFVEPAGDALTLGVKPFNVFARMAGGAMPNPVDQSLLGKHAAGLCTG